MYSFWSSYQNIHNVLKALDTFYVIFLSINVSNKLAKHFYDFPWNFLVSSMYSSNFKKVYIVFYKFVFLKFLCNKASLLKVKIILIEWNKLF